MSASEQDGVMWTKSGRSGSKRHICECNTHICIQRNVLSHTATATAATTITYIWHTSNVSGFECGLLCCAWIINANETRQTRHNRCCAAVLHAPCSAMPCAHTQTFTSSHSAGVNETNQKRFRQTQHLYSFLFSLRFLNQFLLVFSPVDSLWINK